MRCTNEAVRQQAAQHVHGVALVLRIDVRMQQAHRHRFDIGLANPLGQLFELRMIERGQHLAVMTQALSHFEPPAAFDQRTRVVEQQIVKIRAIVARYAPQFQNVAKATRGDQRRFGPGAFHHHIGRHRRAVAEERHVSARGTRQFENPAEAVDRAEHAVFRRGRHLGRPDAPRFVVHHHDVGKGAADIDADSFQICLSPRAGAAARGLRACVADECVRLARRAAAGSDARLVQRGIRAASASGYDRPGVRTARPGRFAAGVSTARV